MRNSIVSKVLLFAVLLVVNCECRRVRRQDLIPFPRVGKRGHVSEAEGWPAEDEVVGTAFDLQDDLYLGDGPVMSLLDTLLRDFHSQAMADTPSVLQRDLHSYVKRSRSSSKASAANARRMPGRRGALGPNAVNSAIVGALWKVLDMQDPEEVETYLQAHLGH
ncbi:uncharacterized protein LOC119583895 [Penaeus monodon]|uniref:uncharacterized protein LOC119583895 n=1 Tax=Penaeus monodon TaxID=6687 RepID=UPI0018A731FD|nr:uncharacterized protein LOC119583895 [Penaeus monodon]